MKKTICCAKRLRNDGITLLYEARISCKIHLVQRFRLSLMLFIQGSVMMKEKILLKLKDIESRYDVRVLLAVESGSRAWGFASPDSDYDVRFVYVHKSDWYLSLQGGRDVIEELDAAGILDISGWDLKKALTLMGRGNCAFVEWLASPIVYYKDEDFFLEINSLKDMYFRRLSAVYHYYHIAMKHNKRGYELKRFMYHIRGLLAARWAIEKGTYPPVPFMELVGAEVDDAVLKSELRELVRLKSQSKEYNKVIVNDVLIGYASELGECMAAWLENSPVEKTADFDKLDCFFIKTLRRYGGFENIL